MSESNPEQGRWEDEQRLAFLWSVLDHISSWIQAADNKAAATLTINSVTIGFLFASGFDLATTSAAPVFAVNERTAIVIISVLGILFLLLSLMCALLCLMGRTGLRNIFAKHFEGTILRPEETLVFFGKIASRGRDDYANLVTKADQAKAIGDLSGQIHVLASIAERKYLWLNRAFVCLAFSILFFAVLAVIIAL